MYLIWNVDTNMARKKSMIYTLLSWSYLRSMKPPYVRKTSVRPLVRPSVCL
jgi:hypothetical protein